MNSPSVSVLLASYRSPWLGESIASVVAQTFDEWELLVLDDASDPGARDTVASFDDSRIRYLHNPSTLGPARNHARGIAEAAGSRIAIINHDDVWEPNFLSALTNALERADDPPVAAFGDHVVIDEDGVIDAEASKQMSDAYGRSHLRQGPIRDGDLYRLAVVDRAIPVAQCCLIDRTHVPPLPRWVGGAYDFYIATQLAATGGPIVYVPERLARFRIHPTNLGSHRSPVRDLVQARIYLSSARGAPTDVQRHAHRQARRAIGNTPRSLIRFGQHKLRATLGTMGRTKRIHL